MKRYYVSLDKELPLVECSGEEEEIKQQLQDFCETATQIYGREVKPSEFYIANRNGRIIKQESPINHILYIIKNGGTNQYKIGITNNLNRRLFQIQTGCPNEIEIIKLWTHYHRTQIEKYERVLHRYYAKKGCKIRANGEWFNLSEQEVTRLCQPKNIQEQNNLIDTMLKEQQ